MGMMDSLPTRIVRRLKGISEEISRVLREVGIEIRQEDADLDEPDNGGPTPLSYAALKGPEEAVGILPGKKEVYPDKPGIDGRTPLFHAAWYVHEEVVKVLLRRKEVNPDKPDNYGRTPLLHAA